MKAEQRVNRSASRLSCVSTGVPAGCACRLWHRSTKVAQVNKCGTDQQKSMKPVPYSRSDWKHHGLSTVCVSWLSVRVRREGVM